jgi:hypothetical protein
MSDQAHAPDEPNNAMPTERLRKGLYRHFKGQHYQVIDVAQHCDTEEYLVVYRALYGEKGLWVRPLTNFVESVERDGILTPRFQWLAPE